LIKRDESMSENEEIVNIKVQTKSTIETKKRVDYDAPSPSDVKIDEEEVTRLTKTLLEKLYRNSIKRYSEETEKLERKGSLEHVDANKLFRQSNSAKDPDLVHRLSNHSFMNE
jgi:hypothetical protein